MSDLNVDHLLFDSKEQYFNITWFDNSSICFICIIFLLNQGDWNGAGMHINFSTKEMREPEKDGKGGMKSIIQAIDRLGARHKEHIAIYGKYYWL